MIDHPLTWTFSWNYSSTILHDLQSFKWVALPAASQTSKTYIVAFDHVFQSLKPVHSIALPGVSSGSVATEVALPTDTEVATSLIYLGDPSQVTIDDLALVIGYGQVPVEQRTPEAIVDLLDR